LCCDTRPTARSASEKRGVRLGRGSSLNAFRSVELYQFVVKPEQKKCGRPMAHKIRFAFIARKLEKKGNPDRSQSGPKKGIGGQFRGLLLNASSDRPFPMFLAGPGSSVCNQFWLVHFALWVVDRWGGNKFPKGRGKVYSFLQLKRAYYLLGRMEVKDYRVSDFRLA